MEGKASGHSSIPPITILQRNSKKACRRCRKHVPSAGVGREKETGYPPIKTDPIVSKRRKHMNMDFQEHTKAGTKHERKLNHIERL